MVKLSATPATFETLPPDMLLTDGIASDGVSMKISYVPLVITQGTMIIDENQDNEERVSFNGVADNADGSATLSNLGRGLSYSAGGYTEVAANAFQHLAGASVRYVIGQEVWNKVLFGDRDSTMDSGKKILWGGAGVWIYGDGTELYFKSTTTAQKSFADLAAAGGTDEKIKNSITDTTKKYGAAWIAAGDGMSASTLNGGANETLSLAVSLDTNPGLKFTNGFLSVKAGNGITLGSYGISSSQVLSDYSDGDVTISNNTTLSKDMYYNNLIVNTGKTLITANFRVFAKTITLNGTGKISCDGNSGGSGGTPPDQYAGGAAGTAGAAIAAGYFPASLAGKAGGAGGASAVSANAGGVGTAGADESLSSEGSNGASAAGASSGAGGTSADGTGGAGGAGAAGGTATSIGSVLRSLYNAISGLASNGGTVIVPRTNAGAGSGRGGGSGRGVTATGHVGASGGGGGGSGGNAGNILVVCDSISGTGNITAIGGNGGNGGNGGIVNFGSQNTGGGGGGSPGAGGSGGRIVLCYRTKTSWSGSALVTGGSAGTGGTGGDGNGTGGAGAAATGIASAGATGLSIQIQF